MGVNEEIWNTPREILNTKGERRLIMAETLRKIMKNALKKFEGSNLYSKSARDYIVDEIIKAYRKQHADITELGRPCS